MVSSVSSVSNASSISQLFSMLDSKKQGYIEQSDLVSAFSQISTNTSSTSDSNSVSQMFAALDSNNDGKVTESEFSTTLSKLQEQLDSQLNSMRMDGFSGSQGTGGMSGMSPPPQDDAGFTKDQLQSQLSEIGSSDSQRSGFINNVVNNFDTADTDGDGKVSFSEAQGINKSLSASSTSSGSTTSTTTDSTTTANATASSEAQLMMKIMQLMHAYGDFDQNTASSQSGLLSVSA
jgi:Ca2+-binding EF-hand superfamily protein